MSILNWFNKPKWQSPNEQVRMTAIQSSQDSELMAQLPTIVHQDSSTKVQITALNKMTDHASINEVLKNHPHKKIQNIARKKLISWFVTDDHADQKSFLDQITDKELIKSIAQDAINISCRKQAIAQINQQGFLGDLLANESDSELQLLILEKLNQKSTLLRLLDKNRIKNKQLKKLIEQKLANNDENQVAEKAIELCLKLEAVVHRKNNDQIDLEQVTEQWTKIEVTVPDNIKMRYRGAYEAARMILDPMHRSQFLEHQKHQRAITKINDITTASNQPESQSLLTLQNFIEELAELDQQQLTEIEIKRLNNLQESLFEKRNNLKSEQKIPSKVFNIVDQINLDLNQPIAEPQQLQKYKQQWQKATKHVKQSEAFSQLTEQFQQLCLTLAKKIEDSAESRDQAANKAISLIDEATQLIESGQLSKAKSITNQIAKNKRLAGYSHPIIKKHKYQLDQVWNQLKELRNWQKWSNDKARRDIIESLVNIHGQGLHPDAVLKKLKDSNEQWYALEDMEKLEGDKFPARNQTLWQEFRKVSKAVFEPTQPFFEKRSEQQNSRLDEINNLLEEINNCDFENMSESELARISRNGINELKSLDQLPPKQRGNAAKKLRKAINKIDAKLNEFYQAAEIKKQKLIEQAEALIDIENIDEAIESAIQLQKQWKSAGIVKQYTERKLWKKFRKANDAIFNKREQIKKANNQRYDNQKKIVNQFIKNQQNIINKTNDLETTANLKSDLHSQWNNLEIPENFMSGELNQLLQLIDEKVKTMQMAAAIDVYDNLAQIDLIYTQLESGDIDENKATELLKQVNDKNLLPKFKNRLNHEVDAEQNHLNQQLIKAEFLTGQSTPEPYMEERMAYQVKVLSERMAGEKNQNDKDQAKQLLEAWYLSPKNNTKFVKANQKRIKQTLKALKALAFE